MKTMWIWFMAILLLGCDQDRIYRLEGEVGELRRSNETLRQEYQTKLQALEQGISTVEGLKKEWETFARSYTPETRQELNKNVDASRAAVDDISKMSQQGEELIAKVRALCQETQVLKDTVAQYEKQARKDNVIVQLRKEREEFLSRAEEATRQTQAAAASARESQVNADEARRRADDAEKAGDQARSSAEKAEQDSAKVKDFDQRITANSQKLLEIYELKKQIIELQQKIAVLGQKSGNK